jgi:hypothetical protein
MPESRGPAMKVRDVQDFQVVAARLARRVRDDRAFAEQVRTKPIETLRSAGLEGDVVRELLTEDRAISARLSAQLQDCTVTCIATCDGCCVTCWFTSWSLAASDPVRQRFGSTMMNIPALDPRDNLADLLLERGHLISPTDSDDYN